MVKNIVVIGASYSGHGLVNSLTSSLPDDHRLILIERNEFVYHIPAIVRTAVVPTWEDKNFSAPVTQDSIFEKGSRHRVLAPVSVIELKKSSVVINQEFEGGKEILFEKCIIATGALQDLPMRPQSGSTIDEFKASLRKTQMEIKAATKILVIGGGAVGIEVTGEISTAYPDKALTLVHSEAGLLHPPSKAAAATSDKEGKAPYISPPSDANLGNKLVQQLRARNVKVVLEDRAVLDGTSSGSLGSVQTIPLQSGGSVEADYIFVSVGNKPNSGLVAAADPEALTSNGYVIVDDEFRVVPGSPESPLAGNYYALGDVAAINSWRTCVSAQAEYTALASIISSELKGRAPKPYKPAAAWPFVVTLGTQGGAGVMPLPFIGNVSLPGMVINMKNKDFFAAKSFLSSFKGSAKLPSAI